MCLTLHFCYAEAYKCHFMIDNSGEMVIYVFLLGFSSPFRQKEWYEC